MSKFMFVASVSQLPGDEFIQNVKKKICVQLYLEQD